MYIILPSLNNNLLVHPALKHQDQLVITEKLQIINDRYIRNYFNEFIISNDIAKQKLYVNLHIESFCPLELNITENYFYTYQSVTPQVYNFKDIENSEKIDNRSFCCLVINKNMQIITKNSLSSEQMLNLQSHVFFQFHIYVHKINYFSKKINNCNVFCLDIKMEEV